MSATLDPVLNDIDRDLDGALERLFAWLRIESISTDPAYAGQCREAAAWLEGNLTALGFETSVEETSLHPVVLAHRPKPGAPHVLFYGHYDVQPVDPLNLWQTPPFEPRLDGTGDSKKIVARGASDDKGQVMTFVEACRAHLAMNGDLPVGVTILVEGAEENGSQGVPEWVAQNRERLKADVALVCDTGMWDRDTPQITTSLRGLAYFEVKVTCADRDLHSGFFGGAAANPIHVLSKILAALHDDEGRVTLPGFYEGVREPPADLLEQWRGLGLTPEKFLGPIGLKEPAGERGRLPIELIQSRPACDVNGIIGGYTGEGTKTVIASQASAKVSFRLVDDQDPEKLARTFEAFVRERVPADCSVEIICYKGSRAVALPYDMPQLDAAKRALAEEWGREAVAVGAGGSIPIVGDFKRLLGLDTLLIGFGLDDDRIHSPNEKYELSSFHKGTRSWARILQALADARG
ncbi:M20/M25/M40 family metallo-hydrolase [Methylorubrum sp. SB2]|uniref:M20/M25/M40 family metallo-hydrolase n=1 Tax=Methylorubrum subtropicum TaxID=3138812 RepID=UPI00313C1609